MNIPVDIQSRRRGLIATIIIHLILLILFAIYGLTHPIPLPSVGIPVNFGTTDMGSGAENPQNAGEPVPVETESIETEEPTSAPEPTPSDVAEEPVVTQEHIETLTAPPAEEENSSTPTETTEPTEEAQDPVEPQPQISDNLSQALNKMKNQEGDGSEGPDQVPGNAGQPDGDDGPNYQGTPGGGNGGGNGDDDGYLLGNRQALNKDKPKYECDEYGIVVMTVKVDRTGKTVDAKVRPRGSTNLADCLVRKAKEAALGIRWQADESAPEYQIGTVTYNFSIEK